MYPEWKVHSPVSAMFGAMDEHSDRLQAAKARAQQERVRALQVQQAERAMAKQVALDETKAAFIQNPTIDSARAFANVGGDVNTINRVLGWAMHNAEQAFPPEHVRSLAAAQGKFNAEFPGGVRETPLPVVENATQHIPQEETAAAFTPWMAAMSADGTPQKMPARGDMLGADMGHNNYAEADNRQRALGLARAKELDAELAEYQAHEKKKADTRAFLSHINPQAQGDYKFGKPGDYIVDAQGNVLGQLPPLDKSGARASSGDAALGEDSWLRRRLDWDGEKNDIAHLGPVLLNGGFLSKKFMARRAELREGVIADADKFTDSASVWESAMQQIVDLQDANGEVLAKSADALVVNAIKEQKKVSDAGFSANVDDKDKKSLLAPGGDVIDRAKDWFAQFGKGTMPVKQVKILLGDMQRRRDLAEHLANRYTQKGVKTMAGEWTTEDGLTLNGRRLTQKELIPLTHFLLTGQMPQAAQEKGGVDSGVETPATPAAGDGGETPVFAGVQTQTQPEGDAAAADMQAAQPLNALLGVDENGLPLPTRPEPTPEQRKLENGGWGIRLPVKSGGVEYLIPRNGSGMNVGAIFKKMYKEKNGDKPVGLALKPFVDALAIKPVNIDGDDDFEDDIQRVFFGPMGDIMVELGEVTQDGTPGNIRGLVTINTDFIGADGKVKLDKIYVEPIDAAGAVVGDAVFPFKDSGSS